MVNLDDRPVVPEAANSNERGELMICERRFFIFHVLMITRCSTARGSDWKLIDPFPYFSRCLMAAGLISVWAALPCNAQDLEPRLWSHLPTGANFAGAGYVYTTGDISFDPVLEIEDAGLELHTSAFRYIRTFEWFDKSARFDFLQAYQDAEWSGLLKGAPASVGRDGWSDTILRISMNLVGAPPLKDKEFAEYRATATESETIVGAGLAVHLPTGKYLDDKLLNLGSNRFTFRPQLGLVHNRGKWSLEATASSWIFTENDNFFGGNQLEQDPLYTVEGHLSYTFRPGLWLGAGIGYGFGGESTVNGTGKDDRKGNLGWEASLGIPVTRQFGIKVSYVGIRTQERVGADLDTIAAGFSFMW